MQDVARQWEQDGSYPLPVTARRTLLGFDYLWIVVLAVLVLAWSGLALLTMAVA